MSKVLLVLALAAAGHATAAVETIAPGIELLRGAFVPGQQPDGNSILVHAPQGLVVVDTGRHASHTQAIADRAAELGLPIVAIVNTHWHLDHIGGNARLRATFPDVAVYASPELRAALTGFLANYRRQLEGEIAKDATPEPQRAAYRTEMALIDAGEALLPTEPVTASGTRGIAGREFVLQLESHAVTGGDVWLFDPAARVLIAGDLVTLPAPFMDTACPSRWQAALGRLDAVKFRTLVPGHGPPLSHARFRRYRQAFDALLACGAGDTPAAVCVEGWLQGVGDLVPASEQKFARSLGEYYVTQSLRGDPAQRAKRCGG